MQKNDKFIDGLSRRRSVVSVPKKQITQPLMRLKSRSVGMDQDLAPRHLELALEKKRAIVEQKKKLEARRAVNDFIKPVKTLDFGLKDEKLSNDFNNLRSGWRKNKKKEAKKPVWWWRHKKISAALVLILVLGSSLVWFGNNFIAKLTSNKSNLFDALMATIENDRPLKEDGTGRSNILVFGTSGYDMNGSNGAGRHDGSQLTDSIMLISLNQKNKDVAMISLPRDLRVDNSCRIGTKKINEIYWCYKSKNNKEKEGAEALMRQVEEVVGVKPQYFAHINWSSLVKIVDTLGGITVTLDENIHDAPTKTYIRKGVPVKLNGEQALGLARARYGTERGDLTRGNSQQKIMLAIKNKIKEKKLSLNEVIGLMNVLGGNLSTNFEISEMKTGVKFLNGLSTKQIRQISLVDKNGDDLVTSDMIGGVSYVVPTKGDGDYSGIRSHVKNKIKTKKKNKQSK